MLAPGRPDGRDRDRVHRRRPVGLRRPRRAARRNRRQAEDPAARPRRHGLEHDVDLRQPDRPLRPLPRSQVRPDHRKPIITASRPSSPASIAATGRIAAPSIAARRAALEEQRQAVARPLRALDAADREPRPAPPSPARRARSTPAPAKRERSARSESGAKTARPTATTRRSSHKPEATAWVQVDLGASVPIEEIRLVPARPIDFPDTPGFGFPARFSRRGLGRSRASPGPSASRPTRAPTTRTPEDEPYVIRPSGWPAPVCPGDGHPAVEAARRLRVRAR